MQDKPLGRTGCRVGAIGLGCAGLGDDGPGAPESAAEVAALQLGIDLGMTLIDTAEVYANGCSEELVGLAIQGRRERVCIATKVATDHLAYADVLAAAEGSLRRLGTDIIDLYQVHWPNPKVPLADTMRAVERLLRDGKVRYIGLSNFSMKELRNAQAALSSERIVSLQAEYNLSDRTVEHVLPYCVQEGLSLIAYSPLYK